ncbi:hypothetical protein [Saccharopolyspora sp. NPDC050642]|uniref:baeRF2 domain-containing protein n=1 Tax=Saccharopolyspora sp. NPDC050642 TaxID=3157099 RepID=UPI0033CD3AC4
MELVGLRHVYEQEGPFATVYLEARSPGEDAGKQVELRWRALRDRLQAAGAPAETLDAIESALSGAPGEEQARGRVLVGAGSAVLLDEPWHVEPGAGDDAFWDALPQLGAYVREAARSVSELVVIADQEGAQVRQDVVTEHRGPQEIDTDVVEGTGHGSVHKPRHGALSHKRIHRRAEETLQRNAKDVVAHVNAVAAKFRPQVVVLAGGVQARTEVREHLPVELAERVVETERGGLAHNASDEALDEELVRIAGEEIKRRAADSADRMEAGLTHGRAVQGDDSVVRAAEQGAVETLLLEDDAPPEHEAFLLKTCAETTSDVELVPAGTGLTDGAGAILRFPVQP